MEKPPALLPLGVKAPDFSLHDQDNALFSLSSALGKWVVIYFYPKAMTPGCTQQACGVEAHQSTWAQLNTLVVGVSPDAVGALATFRQRENLHFPLLADPDHQVALLYGAWQEKSMYGKKYWGVNRMTYIVDPQGFVAYLQPKVKPSEHAAEVMNWLKGHQG